MKIQSSSCDRDRLHLLSQDLLPPDLTAELEEHLEHCERCRDLLDRLVGADRCLDAFRRCLGAEPTVLHESSHSADEQPLEFLAPSDWPDSIGRLGGYEVKGVLGRGGMGVVLKAFDPALTRSVAIKVMSASLASSGAARQRFLREARAAAAVVHEHVVAVYAVVEAAGLPFLVMEYVPGRSLQDRLDKQGILSLPEVLRIGMQTAAGLAAAHAQGLVHRDVKPANILLEDGIERVRLTDFGLARAAADAAITHSGVVAGTPHYMAPEQARGGATDHRADLFSLGSTLYATCAGHPPFRADTPLAVIHRVCNDQPRPLREINPLVPEWLEIVVARLMAKQPAARFQTAAEVADLLARCLAHVQQPITSPLPAELEQREPRSAPRSRFRSSRLVYSALAAVALGMGAFATLSPWIRGGRAPSANAKFVGPPTARRSADSRALDEVERRLDELQESTRAVEADLRPLADAGGQDQISDRSRGLARWAEALERDILLVQPAPSIAPDSDSVPNPVERRRP
jgi:serine/threonine protein kinase